MALLLRRTRSLLVAALLALCSTTAHAQYEKGFMNLSWDDCGVSGAMHHSFACNTNSGSHTMYASAVLVLTMPQVNGFEGVLDMQTNQASLSNWWTIGSSPNCRSLSALTVVTDFTANVNCLDPWNNGGFGLVNFAGGYNGPNRARIRTAFGISTPVNINNVNEYYMFAVRITNARTTGLGSCSGCQDGACIVLSSIKLTQPSPLPGHVINDPLQRQFVVWQGGIGLDACPGATPVQPTTWGSIKSLYR